MSFENIIGQQRVKTFLRNAVQNQRISHAYLFVGDKGVGKEAMALAFASGLLCVNRLDCADVGCPDCTRIRKLQHPDVHFIFPAPTKVKEEERARVLKSVTENPYKRLQLWSNPQISIERIREIRRTSAYKSFEGRGRVVIIADCERMTIEAANALLKILEEPPARTYLIMISSKPSLLLPTITSRCQEVKFDPLSVEAIEEALLAQTRIEAVQARLIARMAGGSFGRALQLLEEDLPELQAKALDFFRKSVQDACLQIGFVEELLSDYQRDVPRLRDLLKMVTNWFRDAMLFRENPEISANYLLNFDQVEVLRKFTDSFPNADLYSSIVEIETALELMDRNVQLNLILIVLLNKLRAHLRRYNHGTKLD